MTVAICDGSKDNFLDYCLKCTRIYPWVHQTRPYFHWTLFLGFHWYVVFVHYYIHTCLLLLISMLWHRQAIFESKGDKLSSSADCRIRTQGLRHLFASRLNARWQTDWANEDQAKNLNSTARPYDQQAFSPLDLTASWLSHLALSIYMFVVVNFDALAQASDIRIERTQVVFLCWTQDSNPRSQTPIRQQTYIHTCMHARTHTHTHTYIQCLFHSNNDNIDKNSTSHVKCVHW